VDLSRARDLVALARRQVDRYQVKDVDGGRPVVYCALCGDEWGDEDHACPVRLVETLASTLEQFVEVGGEADEDHAQ
jgi:hypothetical protein